METPIEKTFLQDSNVSVTNSRFIAAGKTFAMSNISSVSAHHYPKSKLSAIVLMIISVLLIFIGGSTSMIVIGILLLGLSILWYRSIKDTYSVRINSNSGEADGLTSTDKDYINQVVSAVNEAIIHRG